MFALPVLDTDDSPARKQILDFGGYNNAPIISDGEMRDMYNLSSDSFPFISQRKGRGIYAASYEDGRPSANTAVFNAPTTLLSRRGKLVIIDGTHFYFGEDESGMPILIDYIFLSSAQPKTMVSINNKICIFPDKIWFDVRDESELGENEKKWGRIANETTIYTARPQDMEIDGTWGVWTMTEITASANDEAQVLEYQAITPPAADNGYYDAIRWQPGDSVNITGFANESNNITAVIKKVEITSADLGNGVYGHTVTLTFPASSFQAVTAASISSGAAFIDQEEVEDTDGVVAIKISKPCPNLSHVMEHNNRLWGTCDEENAIYACKQGDPTNWYYYREGLASNSYAVGVATDGEWTGCCAYGAHLLFFKQDYIHRVYGTKPANYSLDTIEAHSVEKGSERSIVVVNNTVFYKSRLGIMAYSGTTPVLISDQFGTDRYKNVVAGTNGMKLYFSMESVDRPGEWDFLVFDCQKVMWHKEDHTHVLDFCYHNGKIVYIESGKKYLMIVDADVPVVEIDSEVGVVALRTDDDLEWRAVFGDFDEYIEDKKIYSKLQLRLKMTVGSSITVFIMVDDCGQWEEEVHFFSETQRSVYVPIIPRRCDKFKVKIEGKGRCVIESLAREYREGSEV